MKNLPRHRHSASSGSNLGWGDGLPRREREMVTALGYVRRNSYYPWFTVAEDLNDTLHEVLEL
ncbi:hypothetical protein [Shewanella sp. S23-S33]|uniref:hypothetical protein n=1 Tax=Shewanella sp. S23-S33 TaxID=3342769 RepID=UPI00372D6FDC